VIFAIEVGSRRVHILGATRNPNSACVMRQGRKLAVGERLRGTRFVIRDRDSKFSGPFDDALETEDVRIIRTPIRAPKANAFAERWVRTVRGECLDHLLILGLRQLEQVLREYASITTGPGRTPGLPWPCLNPRGSRPSAAATCFVVIVSTA
jgi:hypothetical protein